MSIEQLIKFIADNGVMVVISAIFLYGCIRGINLGFKYLNNKLFTKKVCTPNEKSVTLSEDLVDGKCETGCREKLLASPFFHNIRYLINFRLPNLNLGDEGRTLVFQDLLIIKFTVFEKRMKELLDFEIKTDKQLYDTTMSVIESAITEYELECRKLGIPYIVIDKFQTWHEPRIKYTIDSIKQICDSKTINSMVEKMYSILQCLDSSLYNTIIDGENSLKSLNGELTGKIYKGIVIGH